MSKNTDEPITIVIPVRNEEGNILEVLQFVQDKVKIPHLVIVVDGCSTDKTYSLVKKYIKKHKNTEIILTPPEKSGFKDSLDIGINAAKTEFVTTFMGDLSDDAQTINNMYKKVMEGSDIVVGSRYIPGGGKIGQPKLQEILSRAVSKSLYLLTGIPIRDVSSPFRMYRKELLTNIKTESRGNEIPIEVIFKAYLKGAKLTEVPTIWRGRKFGKSKFNMLKVVPGYARLYIWVLLNSWKYQFCKIL